MSGVSAAPGDGAKDERPVELVAAALILYVGAGLPLLACCAAGWLVATRSSAPFGGGRAALQ